MGCRTQPRWRSAGLEGRQLSEHRARPEARPRSQALAPVAASPLRPVCTDLWGRIWYPCDTIVLGPCCQPRIRRPNVLMLLNNLDKVLCSEACCGFDEVEESMLRCGRKGCPSPHRFEIAMLAAWRAGARNGAVLRAVRGVSMPAIFVFAASARVAPQQDFETRGLSVPLMANLQDTILHQTTGPVFLVVQEGFFCCKRRFNRKGRGFDWVDVIAVSRGSATCLNSLCFCLPFRRCRSLCMRFRFRAFASPIHCGQRPQAERYPHLSK